MANIIYFSFLGGGGGGGWLDHGCEHKISSDTLPVANNSEARTEADSDLERVG
jgi:hypothetical protein